MRTKAEGIGAHAGPAPAGLGGAGARVRRRYAKLRTQLYPYLVRADRAYRQEGLPIMRHLALAYPNDPRSPRRGRSVSVRPASPGGAGDRAGRDEPERVPAAWTLGRLLGLGLVRLGDGRLWPERPSGAAGSAATRSRRRWKASLFARRGPSCRSLRRRSTRSPATAPPPTSSVSRTATGSPPPAGVSAALASRVLRRTGGCSSAERRGRSFRTLRSCLRPRAPLRDQRFARDAQATVRAQAGDR